MKKTFQKILAMSGAIFIAASLSAPGAVVPVGALIQKQDDGVCY